MTSTKIGKQISYGVMKIFGCRKKKLFQMVKIGWNSKWNLDQLWDFPALSKTTMHSYVRGCKARSLESSSLVFGLVVIAQLGKTTSLNPILNYQCLLPSCYLFLNFCAEQVQATERVNNNQHASERRTEQPGLYAGRHLPTTALHYAQHIIRCWASSERQTKAAGISLFQGNQLRRQSFTPRRPLTWRFSLSPSNPSR